ncbi:MAG: 4Fe-4S binding protein [bacterium]
MDRSELFRRKPQSRLRHINRLRHGVLVLVVLFVAVVPILSLYQSYVAAHAIEWMDGAERVFFDTVGGLVAPFVDDPAEDLDVVKGSVWSAQIGSFKISDPLAVVGQTAAEGRIHWPFVWTALIPVLVTLLLGRVFCGWICPAYLLYEIGDAFRQFLNRAGIRPRNVRLSPKTKYVALAIGVVLSAVLGVAVFPMVYPPALIGREWYYRVYYGAFGSGLTLLALSLLVEVGLSRRAVCRYLCPGGALYSLLGRFRAVRIRRVVADCIRCVKCDDACGLGLQPMTDRTGMECNTCTACIAACPTDALKLRVGWSDAPLEAPPSVEGSVHAATAAQ